MNHISDWLTYIDNKEDVDYLKRPLHQVNMRLFAINESYRSIVLACCDHIEKVALAGFDGYKLPHGTSGANVAIPFNIICVVVDRGLRTAHGKVMINPKLIGRGGGPMIETESNCGSIRLASPIKVARREVIEVQYFDKNGKRHQEFAWPQTQSFTIQHEVDHNNGILITDRQIK